MFEPLTRGRYTMDVERDTALVFEMADGRRLSQRYEPFVRQRRVAEGFDTVFQDRSDLSWRPDILLEVFSPEASRSDYRLRFAAVVDAKYTLRAGVQRALEGILKYQDIRSVDDGSQIVRSIWVGVPEEPDVRQDGDKPPKGAVPLHPDDIVRGALGADPRQPQETEDVLRGFISDLLDHADLFRTAGRRA